MDNRQVWIAGTLRRPPTPTVSTDHPAATGTLPSDRSPGGRQPRQSPLPTLENPQTQSRNFGKLLDS